MDAHGKILFISPKRYDIRLVDHRILKRWGQNCRGRTEEIGDTYFHYTDLCPGMK